MSTVIVQALYKESKKEALEYRRHALQAFATVLHELDIDKFIETYDIAQEIWRTVRIIYKDDVSLIIPNTNIELHSCKRKTTANL